MLRFLFTAPVDDNQPEKGIGIDGLVKLFEMAEIDPSDVRFCIARHLATS
jgi:hypothetical protein